MPKVLIIDDDTTMVSLLRTLLEMDGFEVAETKNWKKILDTVRAEKPDLVLMDFYLPDTNGLEVINQIRISPDIADLRVVMTSGLDVSEQSAVAGADGFLLKPYTPDQLMAIIQANLGEDTATA